MSDTKRDDGGPAFPGTETASDTGNIISSGGMSLRDWFAGKAMQKLVERFSPRVLQESSAPTPAKYNGHEGQDAADALADDAYFLADAMLAAKEET